MLGPHHCATEGQIQIFFGLILCRKCTKVFEQGQELRCSSGASVPGQAGSVPQGSRGGFRQALSSPAMSCLLPGQLSWLPWQGQGGQDGTVPELP